MGAAVSGAEAGGVWGAVEVVDTGEAARRRRRRLVGLEGWVMVTWVGSEVLGGWGRGGARVVKHAWSSTRGDGVVNRGRAASVGDRADENGGPVARETVAAARGLRRSPGSWHAGIGSSPATPAGAAACRASGRGPSRHGESVRGHGHRPVCGHGSMGGVENEPLRYESSRVHTSRHAMTHDTHVSGTLAVARSRPAKRGSSSKSDHATRRVQQLRIATLATDSHLQTSALKSQPNREIDRAKSP